MHVESLAAGQLGHRGRQALGLEAPGVGDHGDPPLHTGRQHLLELTQERAGVAAAAFPRLVQDVHGQLGQPVAGQHVNRAPVDHLAGGVGTVPEEPAAIADPQHVRRAGGRVHAGPR